MNREQKKRITQNITNLKERLIDLDPIIDILIERDVLTLEHRARIESITHPTPQRRFNEFIQLLLGSPEPLAYNIFIEALTIERQLYIVNRLQNTVIKDVYGPTTSHQRSNTCVPIRDSPRSLTRHSPPFKENVAKDEAGAAGGEAITSNNYTGGPYNDRNRNNLPSSYSFGQQLDNFGKNLLLNLSEHMSTERQRMENQMENRLTQFRGEWQAERRDLLQENEIKMKLLQEKVENLRVTNDEYDKLRDKYDKLQTLQESMREREQDRWQRLRDTNAENVKLRRENEMLNLEVKELKEKVRDLEIDEEVLKDNERNDRRQIESLTLENTRLKEELVDKESERDGLKDEVDELYKRLHDSVTTRQKHAEREDAEFQQALERQNTKLDEIFAAVNDISVREKLPTLVRQLSNKPPGLYMAGNAMQAQRTQKKPKA